MNSANYSRAETAYKKGDYVNALKSFYTALKEDNASLAPGEVGLLYYRIGNCLLKMYTFNEAAISYQKALEDKWFCSRAAAQVNLGKAQLGLGRFEDAVQSFNAALADNSYTKPYQAQMGLGSAYTKLGMIVDAGTAYRNAALDERNPNPPKALMSLGGCFMALERHEDAIETFNAIFEFDPQQAVAQKAYESLGQAFCAAGHYSEALEAFDRALEPGSFNLSAPAQADYNKALQASEEDASYPAANMAGFDTTNYGDEELEHDPFFETNGTSVYGAGNVPTANDTGFFDVQESELVKLSKKQMKGQRKLRHTGLKIVLTIVILLILVLGAAVFAYTQGYGWPTQEAVVSGIFDANARGGDTTQYWVGATEEEQQVIERIMDMVPPTTAVDIIYMNRGMGSTEAVVAAQLQQGGTVRYQIAMERDGLGWKISSLDLFFASRQ
ncbi:MAG: tetratricopeptide repeat protein [Coriobacteriia bacterium]|nr:tetratricopeptide repeat protein [Coriobacteriia bacterium]